jgi:hypothetical protein
MIAIYCMLVFSALVCNSDFSCCLAMGKKHKQEKDVEMATYVDCNQVVPKKSKKSKHSSTTEASQDTDGATAPQAEHTDVKKPDDTESVAVDVKITKESKKKRKERENDHRGTEQGIEHVSETTLKREIETSHHSLDAAAETAEDQMKLKKKSRKDKMNRDTELGRNPTETRHVSNAECVAAGSSDGMGANGKRKKAKKSETETKTKGINVAKSHESKAVDAFACKVDCSVATEDELNERQAEKRKRKRGEAAKSDRLPETTDVSSVPVESLEIKTAKTKKSRKQTDVDDDGLNDDGGRSSQVCKNEEISDTGKAKKARIAGQSKKAEELNSNCVEQNLGVVEKKKLVKKSNEATGSENHNSRRNEMKDNTNNELVPEVGKKKKSTKDKELPRAAENGINEDLMPKSATVKKPKKSKECVEKGDCAVLSDITVRDNKSNSNAKDGSVITEPELGKTVDAKKSRKQKEQKFTESKNEELSSETNANIILPESQKVECAAGNSTSDSRTECRMKKKSKKAKVEVEVVDESCPVIVSSESSRGRKRAQQEANPLLDGGELQELEPHPCSDTSEEAKRSKKMKKNKKKMEENDHSEGVKEKEVHRNCNDDDSELVETDAKAKKKSSKRKHSFTSATLSCSNDNQVGITEGRDKQIIDANVDISSRSSSVSTSDSKQKKSKTNTEANNATDAASTEETIPDPVAHRKRKQKNDKRDAGDIVLDDASSSAAIGQCQVPSSGKSRDAEQSLESSSGSKKSRKRAVAIEPSERAPSDILDENIVSSTTVRSAESTSAVMNSNLGQWASAEFELADRMPKFVRLLGGMKNANQAGGLGKAPPRQDAAKAPPTLAMSRVEEERFFSSLEQQFSQAREFRFGQLHGSGLGYVPPPDAGKKLYIDKGAVKSKKFDDD